MHHDYKLDTPFIASSQNSNDFSNSNNLFFCSGQSMLQIAKYTQLTPERSENYFAPLPRKVLALWKYEQDGDEYCELEIPFVLEHPQDLLWWSILIFPSISKVFGDQVCNYILKYVKDVDEGTSYLNSLPIQQRRIIVCNTDSVCRAITYEGIDWDLPLMHGDDGLDSFKKTFERGSKLTVKSLISLMITWEEQEKNLKDADVLPSHILAFLHTHQIDADFKIMMYKRPYLPGDFESYVRQEFQRKGIERVDIKDLFCDRYDDMAAYDEDMYWDHSLAPLIPEKALIEEQGSVNKRRFIKCTRCHKKGHFVKDCWFNDTRSIHGRRKPMAPKKENGRGRAYHRNKRIPN